MSAPPYPPGNNYGYPPPQPPMPVYNQPAYPPAPGYPPPGPQQGGQPPPPGMGFAMGPYGQPVAPQPVVTTYPPPMQQGVSAPNYSYQDPNIPSGLEYLTMIDQLLVKQKVELLEAFVGFETSNKYSVKNSMGQNVFYAVEENDCCTRMCLGANRPFQMILMDNQRNEVMRVNRPFRCTSCFCPCFLQEVDVLSRTGQLLGSLRQNWSILRPQFSVYNGAGDEVLKIEGPLLTCAMCGEVEFKVLTLDKQTTVGKITKQWSGLAREFFTDSDYFGVTFPMDLDVNIKSVLLAATFLIDFMFFEKTGSDNSVL